ncbi:DMT family transporter [Streptomyces sp. Ru87]|nr:DMT family transporter [Streptomyces sp. Ru87]
MSPLVLAVSLSLVSAVAYAAAAVVQERLAADPRRAAGRSALWRSGRWWTAVALNGTGGLLHVLALGFGPLTVVQPLGVLTLVFALPLAALYGGRRAGRSGRRGALAVSAGLAGLLLLTGTRPARALGSADRFGLALVTGVVLVLLVALAWGTGRAAVRSAALACAAGVAFGVASVFTKTVAGDWSPQALAGQLPAVAVTAVLAVTGLLAAQASYRGAGLVAPLATVTVANPLVAAVVGIVLLGEGFRFGALSVPLVLTAGAVTAYGLVLLTRDGVRRGRQGAAEPCAAAEPPVRGTVPAARETVPPGVSARAVPAGRVARPLPPAPVADAPPGSARGCGAPVPLRFAAVRR